MYENQKLSLAALSPEARPQLLTLAGVAFYLALTEVLIGLRSEHLVASAVIGVLAVRGGGALCFVLYFLPIVLTGISYDFFRLAVPLRGEIHVADLYAAELALFGIGGEIPAAWMLYHTTAVFDFIAGIAYLVYLYVPMVVALVLFFKDRRRMLIVGWAFLFTNLVGMVVYILYPAAPPWYVAEHGLGPAVLDAAPSAAGAARFDALLGIELFASFYERSANVFGAMPSLHVAYPASTFFALATKPRWAYPLGAFVVLVSIAAVYLQHHYILDLIAGLACGAAGWGLAHLLMRNREMADG